MPPVYAVVKINKSHSLCVFKGNVMGKIKNEILYGTAIIGLIVLIVIVGAAASYWVETTFR